MNFLSVNLCIFLNVLTSLKAPTSGNDGVVCNGVGAIGEAPDIKLPPAEYNADKRPNAEAADDGAAAAKGPIKLGADAPPPINAPEVGRKVLEEEVVSGVIRLRST
jgi:hypothetical protein